MRRLAWPIAAVLAMAPVASVAQAADGGTIATARAVTRAMVIERTLDPMFQQLMPLLAGNAIAAIKAAPDTPAALKARLGTPEGTGQASAIITEEYMAAFRARYADIREGAAEEYRKAFTEPELRAILEFYQSPVGAKLLRVQPDLQKVLSEQGRAIGRQAGVAAVPRIQARLAALDGVPAK